MARPHIICACCGRSGRIDVNGWVDACAKRWRKAGRPTEGPPRPRSVTPKLARLQGIWLPVTDRIQVRVRRVGHLRARGIPIQVIARDFGVCERTIERYAAAHRHLTSQTQQKAAA
ncbi:hypothetical protein SAMN05216275_14128 [Streptosporangium canum]|uniref:Uncharacterized protein n=1 Tax=Streptosporangium canum TaxID=324952 RepID=A0A1I4DGM8_9ACTN|nr:hypothetical protein [Streptosporangium canum]SFK91940.1 hypothetical protein SAMN05216275_14128 [Streptosporangium canum]